MLRAAIPLASLAGSALLLVFGDRRPLRALAVDGASSGALLAIAFALSLVPLSRDAIGLLFVLAVLVRIAPSAWQVAREQRGALAAFVVALACYAPLAAWVTASAAPYGDQVHYLLATHRLAQGSLDATIDDELLYPNALGALLGVAACRYAFTRDPARPLAAGAILGGHAPADATRCVAAAGTGAVRAPLRRRSRPSDPGSGRMARRVRPPVRARAFRSRPPPSRAQPHAEGGRGRHRA